MARRGRPKKKDSQYSNPIDVGKVSGTGKVEAEIPNPNPNFKIDIPATPTETGSSNPSLSLEEEITPKSTNTEERLNTLEARMAELETKVENKFNEISNAVNSLQNDFKAFLESLKSQIEQARQQTQFAQPNSNPSPNPQVEQIPSEAIPTEQIGQQVEQSGGLGSKFAQYLPYLIDLLRLGASQPQQQQGGQANYMGDLRSMLELIVKIQNDAEERALKRSQITANNLIGLAKLLLGGKIKIQEGEHLE